MGKQSRTWHPNFIEYMEMIVKHPNYKGLRIDRGSDGSLKWIATAKSEVGADRIKWCLAKAKELGFPCKPGVYANVMLAIHPTKYKVCQTCGKSMSLYYHYPNANFLKSINKRFGTSFSSNDHISDIWDSLESNGISRKEIATFFIQKCELKGVETCASKERIVELMERSCREGGKAWLGPGAMSNFPDRYDGFHTYNRCCRSVQDMGRSAENLKSYTKDRRAYEYWSDGNIHAANQFMGSSFFEGISADHIGPISLGFIHDPRYLQPMNSSDNSSKRDRLSVDDIKKIIERETRTGICAMSWYSRLIWEYIRKEYVRHPKSVAGLYRDALKQNMSNVMFVLWFLLENSSVGKDFLIKAFLLPNRDCFNYSYTFDREGDITGKTSRHFTDRSRYEFDRYCRIAIESLKDYNAKDNRNTRNDLSTDEINRLNTIVKQLVPNCSVPCVKQQIEDFICDIQQRIVKDLERKDQTSRRSWD